jgi:3-oxoacyl-[acyl-carrier protein] reductase
MDFTGKVALVTGSGRGIGKAIAMRLAESGATLVINDVGDAAPAEQTVAEIKTMNRQAMAIMADVSSSADVNSMVEKAIADFGKIDILVNNAGITRDQLTMKMTDDEWDKVLTINLRSVFVCTRAVMRPMLKQRSGRIISMSSVVGIIGNAGQANYAASKAGIIGFTKTIAKEVASRGITVNAIAPGFIDTPMTQALPEERRKALMANIPLGCLGTPKDIAETVAFLASEEARYITGQVITVDGGISLGKL